VKINFIIFVLILFTDAACRKHDVDYLLGVLPSEADEALLTTVQLHRKDLFPLFAAAMSAKKYFESQIGGSYTSFLYFYPAGFYPSLTLHFAHETVYDKTSAGTLTTARAIWEGQAQESKWISILQNIWLGSCYTVDPETNVNPPHIDVRLYFCTINASSDSSIYCLRAQTHFIQVYHF